MSRRQMAIVIVLLLPGLYLGSLYVLIAAHALGWISDPASRAIEHVYYPLNLYCASGAPGSDALMSSAQWVHDAVESTFGP